MWHSYLSARLGGDGSGEDRTSFRLDLILLDYCDSIAFVLLDFDFLLAASYVSNREPRHRDNTFLAETTRELTNSSSNVSNRGVEANFDLF